MKTKNLLLLSIFVFIVNLSMGEVIVSTATVVVSGSTGADATYTTLTAAFTAINAVSQTDKNITIGITGTTVETSPGAVLNAGTWTSLKIYPATAAATIGGAFNGVLITLNGADKVTFDGRIGANSANADKNLTITNLASTTTATQTVQFTADAQNNTIQYCNILGSGTAATSGTISFLTGTVLGGNSYNTITNNSITSAADNKRNYSCIYSVGSNLHPNSGNTITNNLFYNTLMRGQTSYNIYLNADNNSWNISGNSFYETASFVPTANVAFKIIEIQGGYGYTISGNYLGGNAANCSGSFSKTNAKYNDFTGISLATSAGAASTVNNNTIKGISWGNAGKSNFTGITISGVGDVNVTNNTIGSNTGNGSITYSGGGAAVVANIYGIYISTTGSVDCQWNKVGSINASNTFGATINAILKAAVTGSVTISNNTIGSTITANSINSTTNAAQNVNGIQNLGLDAATIENNTIANLSNASATGDVIGVKILSGANSVNANLIHSLYTPNSSNANIFGVSFIPGNASTQTTTISNNIINLASSNNTTIAGINEIDKTGTTAVLNILHNTVYIGGAPTAGTLPSAAYSSMVFGYNRTAKNNIFVNTRSNNGAIGSNYAMLMASNTCLTIDNNDYFSSGASGGVLAYVGSGELNSLSALQTATGGDIHSLNIDPSFSNAGGTLAIDYKTNAALNLIGTTTGVSTDYAGISRSGSMPRMGAYESSLVTSAPMLSVNKAQILRTSQGILVDVNHLTTIELFTLNGVLMHKLQSAKPINIDLKSGVYVIRINTEVSKIVI